MIGALRIERFKCFNDQKIHFKNLTVLAGGNATGKSSVIQGFLLFKQSLDTQEGKQFRLRLNGKLTNIGTVRDALYSQSQEDSLSFTFKGTEGNIGPLTFTYKTTEDKFLETNSGISDVQNTLFKNGFTYLNAERLGPRLSYQMSDLSRDELNVGIQGEYTANILSDLGIDYKIPNKKLAFPGENNLQLLHQTKLWMQKIVPDLEIDVHDIKEANQYRIGLKNQATQDFLRPTNIGFGISYTLPIIVAALMAKKNGMLIIENPEAHLHPRAQSEMGRFLAYVANAGVQVILETHSDHILNGVRLAAKKAEISAEIVSLQYFMYKNKRIEVSTPIMDKNGRIDKWPAGFFDQMEKDLLDLM